MVKCPATQPLLTPLLIYLQSPDGELEPAELSFTPSTWLTQTFLLVPKAEDLGSHEFKSWNELSTSELKSVFLSFLNNPSSAGEEFRSYRRAMGNLKDGS